jgi:uncharacterized membrane protein
VKAKLWLPVAVFLAVSIPLVLLLNAISVGGEYRIWIAIGAGALATAFAQSRMQKSTNTQNKKDQE